MRGVLPMVSRMLLHFMCESFSSGELKTQLREFGKICPAQFRSGVPFGSENERRVRDILLAVAGLVGIAGEGNGTKKYLVWNAMGADCWVLAGSASGTVCARGGYDGYEC